MTKADIKAIIFARRLPVLNEAEMQDRIGERLTAAGINVEREVRLPGKSGRIDFLVILDGVRIGIETKVVSGGGNTARQLLRYALSNEFDELVLVTSRAFQIPVNGFESGEKFIPLEIWQVPI